jgi:hypothetical protein
LAVLKVDHPFVFDFSDVIVSDERWPGRSLRVRPRLAQLVCGTDDDLRAFLFGPPLEGRLRRPARLDQVTVINLTDLILNIRRQAAKKKIDLGVPLFMTPDDPRYQELRRELLEIREADTKTVQKAAAFAALRERITSHVAIQ